MKNVIITSELNTELLPPGEFWLVIGPFVFGKSRSLPIALERAASELCIGGGSFTARVIPEGNPTIENDGSYSVEGWTPEQKTLAHGTTRQVAITKTAASKWGKAAAATAKLHRKALNEKR